MLHHYIVSCTPNLSSWGPSFNFSAPVWIPVNTAGEWWLRSTKYNAKYSPLRKRLQKYKNSQHIVFDKKKTKRVSTKSASQPVGHLGNSLCSCSHLSSHLGVGKLKFKYSIGIVNLTLKELKSKNSVEMLWKGFEIRPEMLRGMFIHRPTFIYNVLSPLSARQDGFHWRTWWKTPVSLFSHLFRIFHHPFQCLHACLPSPHLRWRPSQDWEEHLDKRCDITDRLKISNIGIEPTHENIEPIQENNECWTNPWKYWILNQPMKR